MGKNHGKGMSQVRTNQNNKPKMQYKEKSKIEIEDNETIGIGVIGIFIDYVEEGAQCIGMIRNWPVNVG